MRADGAQLIHASPMKGVLIRETLLRDVGHLIKQWFFSFTANGS